MDVDPLADTVPPRHAIESDEEEDEYNPLHTSSSSDASQIADVKLIGSLPTGHNLVLATGDIAKFWARGAALGEQSGAVAVNGVQVGLVFNPAWTKATVIISEALTRLPVWALYPYAQTILDALKPTGVSLFDIYPVHTFIASEPVSPQDAPLRYLATSAVDSFIKERADAFPPPNMIQSASAAFLSILGATQKNGTLILAPSPHIPHPPPRTIKPSNLFRLSEDRFEWSQDMMNTAQEALFHVIGEAPTQKWEPRDKDDKPSVSKERTEVGEGGMYI